MKLKRKNKLQWHPLQTVATLNKVMMAYFLNEADNFGVNFNASKPTFPPIKNLVGTDFSGFLIDDLPYCKEQYHCIIKIEDFDIDFLNKNSIEDWMTKDRREELKGYARSF